MVAGSRRGIACGGVAALAALTAVGAYAAGETPTLTNLSAKPKRFCVKRSDTCPHPGTTVHFRLATPAKVYVDIRPRSTNTAGYLEVARKFPAGPNSVRVTDRRLTPGRWTFKAQAVNSVGATGPSIFDVRVVKSAP